MLSIESDEQLLEMCWFDLEGAHKKPISTNINKYQSSFKCWRMSWWLTCFTIFIFWPALYRKVGMHLLILSRYMCALVGHFVFGYHISSPRDEWKRLTSFISVFSLWFGILPPSTQESVSFVSSSVRPSSTIFFLPLLFPLLSFLIFPHNQLIDFAFWLEAALIYS